MRRSCLHPTADSLETRPHGFPKREKKEAETATEEEEKRGRKFLFL